MSTITDALWDTLLRELRYLHLHATNGPTLRQHLDAYIDARIAEKARPPFRLASNEEVAEFADQLRKAEQAMTDAAIRASVEHAEYAARFFKQMPAPKPVPPQAPVPDGQSRAEFWNQERERMRGTSAPPPARCMRRGGSGTTRK